MSAISARFEEIDGVAPHLIVDLTWDTDTPVTISRRDRDISRPVRGCEPLAVTAATPVTVTDWEAPLGQSVVYEAVDADGRALVSAPVTCTTAQYLPNDLGWSTDEGSVWLRHLTIPQLSRRIDLSNADTPSFTQTRTVQTVLNRSDPLVLTDARRKNLTSTLDIRTWSLEEAAALRKLLTDNSILLVSVPASARWGITNHYVALGEVTEERLWQEWAPFEGRVFHLPIEVVERPAGGVVFPACCYWSKQDDIPSYLAFDVQYTNYAKLASCNVNAVAPPDPPDNQPIVGEDNVAPTPETTEYVELATVSRTTSQGTYGSSTSDVTYGTPTTEYEDYSDGLNMYDGQPLPAAISALYSELVAGNRYTVHGSLTNVVAGQTGTLTMSYRLVPGSLSDYQANGANAGTVVFTKTKNVTAGQVVSFTENYQFVPTASSAENTIVVVLSGSISSVSNGQGGAQQAFYLTREVPTATVTYDTDSTLLTSGGDSAVLSNAALPRVLAARTVTLTKDWKYALDGEINDLVVANSGTLAIQVRYTAGSSATATSGTLVSTSTVSNVTSGQTVGTKFLNNGQTSGYTFPNFIAPSSGTFTITLVAVGTAGPISTPPDRSGTSGFMAIYYRKANTTGSSTTVVPADDVTLKLTAQLVSGTTYHISGTQFFKNATEAVTFTARYVFGPATGTSPGIGVTSGTASSIGATPVSLNSTGSFLCTTSGQWEVVTVVKSAQPVDDATEAGKAAVLTIGYYRTVGG